MSEPAPAPWDWHASGKPGGNGDLNIYVIDRDGRKIAAVWGKRGEKEHTVAMIAAAPDMLAALEAIDANGYVTSADVDMVKEAIGRAKDKAFL